MASTKTMVLPTGVLPPTKALAPSATKPATKRAYNFSSHYSVVLNHPVDTVYEALARGGAAMERALRLSDVCTGFALGEVDNVELPGDVSLLDWGVDKDRAKYVSRGEKQQSIGEVEVTLERAETQTSGSSSGAEGDDEWHKRGRSAQVRTRTLQRQAFLLEETIPLAFGLVKHTIEVRGLQTWDDEARVGLYETQAPFGVVVWKTRAFEELEGKTRVTETLRGHAPVWLRAVTQAATVRIHRTHMEKYHALFR